MSFCFFCDVHSGAKFEDHCSNISGDIHNSVFYRFSGTIYDSCACLNHNVIKRDAGGKEGKLLCCKRIFDRIKANLAEIQLKKNQNAQKTHFLQKVLGVNGLKLGFYFLPGDLSLTSCELKQIADWYTIFFNPKPDYVNTLHCTQEAVYPL